MNFKAPDLPASRIVLVAPTVGGVVADLLGAFLAVPLTGIAAPAARRPTPT